MITRTLASTVIASALVISTQGCTTGHPMPRSTEPISVRALTGEWAIVSIEGEDTASLLPDGAKAPTLQFSDEGRLSGFAGVNRFSGSLDTEKLISGKWDVGQVVSTKMAGPPELMALEQRILSALDSADAIVSTGGSIVLTAKGKESLALVRAE